jgi:hypothetical protein
LRTKIIYFDFSYFFLLFLICLLGDKGDTPLFIMNVNIG